ncbi:MAG: hypothetical protein CVT88_00065 [Candidatus Altiarchaeales archaeon HGW-Altiarchaeales-1]|nr:MAG: hypothetical protein CVT89_01900 [Candidatus Altiarchaeales archaeon HGW-Altiarchaeales-2]PKP61422.1 MAG: hypothetical protein CVT88_00065 [Candidatus Altiarchaeales archaeon HGW-Altiarchaeales-1]
MGKSNVGVAILGFGFLAAGVWLIAKLTGFLDKKEYLIYDILWGIISVILIIAGMIMAYRALKSWGKEEIPTEFWNGVYKMGFSLILIGGILLGIGLILYLLVFTQVIEGGASQMKLLNAGAIIGLVFIGVGGMIAFFANNKKIEGLDKNIGIKEKEKDAKEISDKVKRGSETASRGSEKLGGIRNEKPLDENR